MEAIQTRNLTKYYGKARGVLDLNLTVQEGDFFGFIGPNGAGKSTTIRSLLGLITPTSGEGLVLGKSAAKEKAQVLKEVGYMPSEAFFYERMKVSQVIKLAADLHKKDCAVQAKELCERLELDTAKRIGELSLGNRKKVSIVCAMQHEPSLFILDEPTSGLDPLMQKEFFALLQERNEKGATVFLSSHVLSEIQKYCHHTAIIKEGQLVYTGSVAELSQSNAVKVDLRFASEDAEKAFFDKIPVKLLKNIVKEDGVNSFFYRGKPQTLLSAMEPEQIERVNITNPTLDEIVMHYYDKKEEA